MPNDRVTSRNEWIFGNIKSGLPKKSELITDFFIQFLNRTTSLFKYNNLPETIKTKDLETYNQVGGYSIWTKVNGKLYTFQGGLGGEPNPYYLPTIAVVANPALAFSAELGIDKECVVMLNDHYYRGLTPMFNKYANLLAESVITMLYVLRNERIPALIQADNEQSKETAEEFVKQIIDGDGYGIIGNTDMFDGIKTYDFNKNRNSVTQIIEAIQYIKGTWYNEIGLQSAFNMKRESLNKSEISVNEDVLYPTIDTMLECRKTALDKINNMFGTDITVELNGVWADKREMDKIEMEQAEAEVVATEEQAKPDKLEGKDEKSEVKKDESN